MTWFFDFNKLIKCTEIRHKQLKKEKIIDERLQKCKCDVVRKYLFAYRTMNREMADTLYQTSILDTPQIMIEQLDKIQKHFEKMENMKDICEELPDIIKDM